MRVAFYRSGEPEGRNRTKIDDVYSLLNGEDKPMDKSVQNLIEKLKPLKEQLDKCDEQTARY